MKRVFRLFSLTALSLFGAAAAEAQETKVETTIAADVVNQYIWRGQELGNVSLQPTLGIDYKGLSLSAWGSVGLTDPDDTKEFDLTLAYSIGGFNIGVTDYWFNTGNDPEGRYFMYEAHRTNHVFEANVGYDFGIAKNLSVGAALTFIRGAMKNASVITSDGRAASITADSDNAESLSSLSLSIGLRYNL